MCYHARTKGAGNGYGTFLQRRHEAARDADSIIISKKGLLFAFDKFKLFCNDIFTRIYKKKINRIRNESKN